MTDAITIQNPRNRGGSTGHVLAKRSVTFTEIRTIPLVIPVSYGLPGVILPAVFLVALQGGKKVSWALPAAVAAVAQGDLLHAALAAAASVALLALLSTRCRIRVWPVGRWAYGYYPAHLLLLVALAP